MIIINNVQWCICKITVYYCLLFKNVNDNGSSQLVRLVKVHTVSEGIDLLKKDKIFC